MNWNQTLPQCHVFLLVSVDSPFSAVLSSLAFPNYREQLALARLEKDRHSALRHQRSLQMLVCTFGDSPGEIALSWTLSHQCHHFHPCQRPKKDQMPGLLQCSAKLWRADLLLSFDILNAGAPNTHKKRTALGAWLRFKNLTKPFKKIQKFPIPRLSNPAPRMASFQFSSCWSNPDPDGPDGHRLTVRPGLVLCCSQKWQSIKK